MRILANWCKFSALLFMANAAVSTALAEAKMDWVQLRAVISYTREGTIATAQEGKFVFSMKATLDQVMVRVKPDEGEEFPSYYLDDGYEPSFGLAGEAKLEADVTQVDGAKTYTARAALRTELRREQDLQLREVKTGAFFGPGLMPTLFTKMRLEGTVTSNYPRMPGVEEADQVLLWPSPVKFDPENGFTSEGEYTIFPVPGERPKNEQLATVFDMTYATDNLPGLGGFRPPGIGGTTERRGDSWIFRFKKHQKFELGTGGSYTDTISVEIQPVALTLPLPRKRPE